MTKRRINTVLFLSFFILAVIMRNECIEGVKEGILISVKTVVPSLFPFLFLSSVLTNLISDSGFSSFAPLFLGTVCGFPIGAGCVSDLYKSEKISKEFAESLLFSVNNAGFAFVLILAGKTALCDEKAGFVLFFLQFLFALAGFIVSQIKYKNIKNVCKTQEDIKTGNLISESVKKAAMSSINISSYILLFSFVRRVIFSVFKIDNRLIVSCISMFLEISGGIADVCKMPQKEIIPIVFAGIGWGGVSVHLQTLNILQEAKLSPKKYIAGKISMAVFLFVCGLIYKSLL